LTVSRGGKKERPSCSSRTKKRGKAGKGGKAVLVCILVSKLKKRGGRERKKMLEQFISCSLGEKGEKKEHGAMGEKKGLSSALLVLQRKEKEREKRIGFGFFHLPKKGEKKGKKKKRE